jgi:hypothetical protein
LLETLYVDSHVLEAVVMKSDDDGGTGMIRVLSEVLLNREQKVSRPAR